jgi:hypothetical protein
VLLNERISEFIDKFDSVGIVAMSPGCCKIVSEVDSELEGCIKSLILFLFKIEWKGGEEDEGALSSCRDTDSL